MGAQEEQKKGQIHIFAKNIKWKSKGQVLEESKKTKKYGWWRTYPEWLWRRSK